MDNIIEMLDGGCITTAEALLAAADFGPSAFRWLMDEIAARRGAQALLVLDLCWEHRLVLNRLCRAEDMLAAERRVPSYVIAAEVADLH